VLSPKRVKHRKVQKGRMRGQSRGSKVNFGEYGLQAIEPGRVTARQIEAARVALTRSVGRLGNIWIRIYPDKPITQKPVEVRMGKGKGNPEYWVAVVKPGRVIYEIGGVTREQAEKALRLASFKLPVQTRFVERGEGL